MELLPGLLLVLLLVTCVTAAVEQVVSEEDEASLRNQFEVDKEAAYRHFKKMYHGTPYGFSASTDPIMKKIRQTEMANLERNVNSINAHNKKYKRGETEYTMSLSPFSSMSSSERQQFLGLRNVSGVYANQFLVTEPVRYRAGSDKVSYPDSKDWREKMSSVQQQGKCGACWTFPAVAQLEFAYENITGQRIRLSEQELLDCTYEEVETAFHKNYDACEGGDYIVAWDWLINNTQHLAAKNDYRYRGDDGTCKKDRYTNRLGLTNMELTGYVHVTPGNADKIVEALQERPLAVAIYAGDQEGRLFEFKRGVYDECSGREISDHQVTLTGYTATYWEFKNSWGMDWGYNGYGRFKREGNTCNILNGAYYITYKTLSTVGPPTVAPITNLCADIYGQCAEYNEFDFCTTGDHIDWMATNCAATCGKCEEPFVCEDKDHSCASLALDGDCTAPDYYDYIAICPKSCGTCPQDKLLVTIDKVPPITVNVETGDGSCTDDDDGCAGWATSGFCEDSNYSDFVSDHCKKSCGLCAGQVKVTVPGCVDAEEKCAGWADGGYCRSSSHAAYMNTNCKKSCGLCAGQVKDDCVDANASGKCEGWAKYGYCQISTVYMRANCQKSCGFCSGGGGGGCSGGLTKCAGQVKVTVPGCVDEEEACAGWADSGYCERSSNMKDICQKSCGVCDGV